MPSQLTCLLCVEQQVPFRGMFPATDEQCKKPGGMHKLWLSKKPDLADHLGASGLVRMVSPNCVLSLFVSLFICINQNVPASFYCTQVSAIRFSKKHKKLKEMDKGSVNFTFCVGVSKNILACRGGNKITRILHSPLQNFDSQLEAFLTSSRCSSQILPFVFLGSMCHLYAVNKAAVQLAENLNSKMMATCVCLMLFPRQ